MTSPTPKLSFRAIKFTRAVSKATLTFSTAWSTAVAAGGVALVATAAAPAVIALGAITAVLGGYGAYKVIRSIGANQIDAGIAAFSTGTKPTLTRAEKIMSNPVLGLATSGVLVAAGLTLTAGTGGLALLGYPILISGGAGALQTVVIPAVKGAIKLFGKAKTYQNDKAFAVNTKKPSRRFSLSSVSKLTGKSSKPDFKTAANINVAKPTSAPQQKANGPEFKA